MIMINAEFAFVSTERSQNKISKPNVLLHFVTVAKQKMWRNLTFFYQIKTVCNSHPLPDLAIASVCKTFDISCALGSFARLIHLTELWVHLQMLN